MPKSDDDIQKDKEKLLASLKDSARYRLTRLRSGFSVMLLYRWYKEDPDFKARADDDSRLPNRYD